MKKEEKKRNVWLFGQKSVPSKSSIWWTLFSQFSIVPFKIINYYQWWRMLKPHCLLSDKNLVIVPFDELSTSIKFFFTTHFIISSVMFHLELLGDGERLWDQQCFNSTQTFRQSTREIDEQKNVCVLKILFILEIGCFDLTRYWPCSGIKTHQFKNEIEREWENVTKNVWNKSANLWTDINEVSRRESTSVRKRCPKSFGDVSMLCAYNTSAD